MAQPNNKLANKEAMSTLKIYLQRALPTIEAVLPKHMTGERIMRIVAATASRDPLLLECTPLSVINAVVSSSQLGLEPVGPLGQAYLVPFNNKNGNREAQLIIGYRGMIELARRSGNIINIEAHVVHERDNFDFAFGLNPKLDHKPYMGEDDPGKVIAAYAIARFKDGGYQTDIMSIGEINAIKKRSKSGNFGPWVTDFDEMARKTVVKRLCKYLPMSVELAQAVAVDNAAESGESQLGALDIGLPDEMTIDVEAAHPKTKSDTIAEKLGATKEAASPETQANLFDEAAERQSRVLAALDSSNGGLGLTPTEQAAYIKKHTGKLLGDLTDEDAEKVIAAAAAELKKKYE